MKSWPTSAEEAHTLTETLVALLGEDGARKLAEAFGGRRLSVPRQPGAAHPITVAIGPEGAAKLASTYHGHGIDVPMLHARRERISELDRAGLSRSEIARKVRVTERRVYQVLAEERDGEPELPLFGRRAPGRP